MREYLLDLPSFIISLTIYIFISKLTIQKYFQTRDYILIIFLILELGLIYDIIIILLGFLMPNDLLLFFNKLRFILHGILVPSLILFCGYALNASGKFYYGHLFFNIILTITGLILGIITKLTIVEGSLIKRCIFSKDNSLIIILIFSFINIICVIYMIIVGIILFINKREKFFLLSGIFMFLFSAIGPTIGKTYLNYLFSMYGEILMVIFLYLFFRKKMEFKIKSKNLKIN